MKILTRLSLGDDIVSLDTGQNGTLLDSRGLFKTIGIDTAQQFFLKVHIIEIIDDLPKK